MRKSTPARVKNSPRDGKNMKRMLRPPCRSKSKRKRKNWQHRLRRKRKKEQ